MSHASDPEQRGAEGTPRLRLAALMIALLAHALFLGAVLSPLQVGTFALQKIPEALPERSSHVSAIDAVIFSSPNHLAGRLPHEQLNLPGASSRDLQSIHIDLPFPEAEWGVESGPSVSQYATALPGLVGVHCEVHIHQDPQGRVQAIDLGSCTENAAWQRTLLRAIVQAATMATPSSALRPPELTLTLKTNQISPATLAHLLSYPRGLGSRIP